MRCLLLSIALSCCGLPLLAQSSASEPGGPPPTDLPGTVDAEAISAYRAGDLETARTLWLEILEQDPSPVTGPERGRLLYNLGNLAVRAKEDLEAVGWYTASLRVRPRDASTRANLEFARLNAELPPADRGDLSATFEVLLASMTRGESAWLALFSLLPLLVTFAFEALHGGRRWRWASLGAVCFALIGSIPLGYQALEADSDPVLIIASNGAAGRAEPRASAEVIQSLEPGTKLERIDEFPGWVQLELDRSHQVWVPAAEVFPLAR